MICVSDQNLDYLLCDISLVALHKAILYTLHTVVVYTKHDKNGSEKMHYNCPVHSAATGQCSLPACLQYTYLKPVAYLHSPPPPPLLTNQMDGLSGRACLYCWKHAHTCFKLGRILSQHFLSASPQCPDKRLNLQHSGDTWQPYFTRYGCGFLENAALNFT